MSDSSSRTQVLTLTAQIVSAHVSHNATPSDTLPGLIQAVFGTLTSVGTDVPAPDKRQPAVPVKRSVFPEYIVCLEDGKKLKMLKRHLATSYNMTPEQYRERWGLPADYPMVAPNYAARRSALAKEIGLGRRPVAAEPEHVREHEPEPAAAPPVAMPAKRGRKPKLSA